MKMISILLASGLRPFMTWFAPYRDTNWPERYFQWVANHLVKSSFPAAAKLAIPLLPLLLLLLAIRWLIGGLLFGLIWLLFALFALLYTQGILTNSDYLDPYLAAVEKGDADAQAEALAAFPKTRSSDSALSEEWSAAGELIYRLLTQSNEKIFALFFWFLLGGPVGVLTYYLLIRFERWEAAREVDPLFLERLRRIIEVVEWIPARLGVISFALVGDFSRTFDAVTSKSEFDRSSTEGNAELLMTAGVGALGCSSKEEALTQEEVELLRDGRDLVSRAFILWLGLIAVGTLIGVLS
jgi:AmpE protein